MSASFTAKLVRRTLTGAATFLIGCAGTAVAADYPNHSIRMIVPFATGGSTDLVGRFIAEFVGRELGQSIVVENKGGAGGAVGAEQIARATPDGYTIGMATVSTHGSNPAIYKGLKVRPGQGFRAHRKCAGHSERVRRQPKSASQGYEGIHRPGQG